MVAADLWVQAVTNEAITKSMVWSITLSSVFATIAVFVFTGSLIITLLATLTMAGINILVLGLYWVLGWRLGAIEGVSITVLVGLSVDFCLHFSEAFTHSPLLTRKDRARCALFPHCLACQVLDCRRYVRSSHPSAAAQPAFQRCMRTQTLKHCQARRAHYPCAEYCAGRTLTVAGGHRDSMMLMGTPVLASAASTVLTALPLWLCATVALNQFGVVIAISLSVSFFYAAFMLVPLLATLGPEGKVAPEDETRVQRWWRRVKGSTLTRAAVASGACLGILVRCLLVHMLRCLRVALVGKGLLIGLCAVRAAHGWRPHATLWP